MPKVDLMPRGELGLMLVAKPPTGPGTSPTELAFTRRIAFDVREAVGDPPERLPHASDKPVFRDHAAPTYRDAPECPVNAVPGRRFPRTSPPTGAARPPRSRRC